MSNFPQIYFKKMFIDDFMAGFRYFRTSFKRERGMASKVFYRVFPAIILSLRWVVQDHHFLNMVQSLQGGALDEEGRQPMNSIARDDKQPKTAN
jgi:hypothetical protein